MVGPVIYSEPAHSGHVIYCEPAHSGPAHSGHVIKMGLLILNLCYREACSQVFKAFS